MSYLTAAERLSAPQLADLVNYTLELPVRRGARGIVVYPAIHCCVMQSWTQKRMGQVQVWCEQQLQKNGIFGPIPPAGVGRSPGCSRIPREVERWVIIRRRYAA